MKKTLLTIIADLKVLRLNQHVVIKDAEAAAKPTRSTWLRMTWIAGMTCLRRSDGGPIRNPLTVAFSIGQIMSLSRFVKDHPHLTIKNSQPRDEPSREAAELFRISAKTHLAFGIFMDEEQGKLPKGASAPLASDHALGLVLLGLALSIRSQKIAVDQK